MDELLAALGYAGDTLDKSLGGRAVRGVLGGHYDEALSALPFSDTLGLTDPTRRVSGEDLVTGYGLASPGSWGATLGGIGAEMLLDPATLATGGLAAFKGLRAAGKGLNAFGDAGTLARRLAEITPPPALDRRLAELGSTVDPLDRLRVGLQPMARREPGALAHFFGDESGALRPFQEIGKRTDPDVVNRLPWYHGSATPGLTPGSLDALRSSPDNLLGRGLYLTDAPDVAAESAAWRAGHHGGEPVVYGAGTDLGRILDLSRPIASDPAAAEAVLAHLEAAGAGGGQLARLKRWAAGPDVTHGRFLEDAIGLRARLAEPPGSDAIVQGLRDRGYDALSHVYGQASPVGGTPYASLVALDPNDTISHVGRSGQITRFDPHDPHDLLRRLGLGG